MRLFEEPLALDRRGVVPCSMSQLEYDLVASNISVLYCNIYVELEKWSHPSFQRTLSASTTYKSSDVRAA